MKIKTLWTIAGWGALMGGAVTLISCNEQNNTTSVQKKQASDSKKKPKKKAKRKKQSSAEELPFLICNADWDKFWSYRLAEERQKFADKNEAVLGCKEGLSEAIIYLNIMLEDSELTAAGLGKVTAAYTIHFMAMSELHHVHGMSFEEIDLIIEKENKEIFSLLKRFAAEGGSLGEVLVDFFFSDDVSKVYSSASLLCNLYLLHAHTCLKGVTSASEDSLESSDFAWASFMEFYWTYLYFTMIYGAQNYDEESGSFVIFEEEAFRNIYTELKRIKKAGCYNSPVIRDRVDAMLLFFERFAR